MAQPPATPAAEFDAYEATGAVPSAPAPTPAPELDLTRAALTLSTLVPEPQTVTLDDATYRLSWLPALSVGKQTYILRCRANQIALMVLEEQGQDLDDDQLAQQNFLLGEIVRAAVPSMPTERREALTDFQAEAIVTLFFEHGSATVSPAQRRQRPSTTDA